MIAIFLSPIFLLVHGYLLWRAHRWCRALSQKGWSRVLFLLFCLLDGAVVLSPLAAAFGTGTLQGLGRLLVGYSLLPTLYLLVLVGLISLVGRILRRVRKMPKGQRWGDRPVALWGAIILLVVLGASVYGAWNGQQIRKTHYDVTVETSGEPQTLRVVLLADVHLNPFLPVRKLTKMAAMVEEMEPDLVVYAGDIFDNDFDAILEPEKQLEILSGIKSTYGSYACWGNHDLDEKILAGFTFRKTDGAVTSDVRMDEFLERAGIRLLEDEAVLIDDAFYLVGRRDASTRYKSGTDRLQPDALLEALDREKPILVIDHQPGQLQELAEAGVDLALSGHTHNGQVFPGNLTIDLFWDNAYGLLQVGDMTDIVTSGLGVWGTPMRIGTYCEVVEIDLTLR